jgi:hypothetical protein
MSFIKLRGGCTYGDTVSPHSTVDPHLSVALLDLPNWWWRDFARPSYQQVLSND